MFLDWSLENPNNGFDPEVPKYPSTVTWCAYDKDGPLAFLPIQQPLMLESLAVRPGATKLQIASALKELTQATVTQAHIKGAGEIYYLGTDDDTDVLATNQIFEQLPYKVFRVRIKNLEGSNENNN